MAADGIILIGKPHYQDYVKRGGRVIEKFGHKRLHSWKIKDKNIR